MKPLVAALGRPLRHKAPETTRPPRGGSRRCLYVLGEAGAGDGIRTHDFNLGKVALYP
jgi:hypothetical protein